MLFAKISAALDGLRPSERKVAEYVLARPTIAAELTIADLASAVSVSEPTVIRFCRAVGSRGFQDLKRSLMRDMERRKVSLSGANGPLARAAIIDHHGHRSMLVEPALVAEIVLRQGRVEIVAAGGSGLEDIAAAARSRFAALLQGAMLPGVGVRLELGGNQLVQLSGAPAESGLADPSVIVGQPVDADLLTCQGLVIAALEEISTHLGRVAGADTGRQAVREQARQHAEARVLAAVPRRALGGAGAAQQRQTGASRQTDQGD